MQDVLAYDIIGLTEVIHGLSESYHIADADRLDIIHYSFDLPNDRVSKKDQRN